jgi:hypothetical protein
MLPEIFEHIREELQTALEPRQNGKKKLRIEIGPGKRKSEKQFISMELLRFGNDTKYKNFPTGPSEISSLYNFSFFIAPQHLAYEDQLLVTETICDHFNKTPFIQVNIGGKEYEVAMSAMELDIEAINEFWIARQRPHGPVLFYQVRISEV